MARGNVSRQIEHLLRRAGFGARPDELDYYTEMSVSQAVEALVDYESVADTVDSFIGKPGYAGTTTRGVFSPQTNVTDARQRWLFRMVHSDRPLQEKMTLFWHNHFATAYTKIAGTLGAIEATRTLASKPSEDPAKVQGQIEMLRANALGNFRDILLNIAKDPAMLVWLDGRTNTKAKPQENFAREIMELFTVGVGHYVEADVYAGARVFSGWNLVRTGSLADNTQHYQFIYNAGQHDTEPKTFSFPIYANGSTTIPSRSAADGMQDGIDFINALAAHPQTGRYLAGKLWRFFVSEFRDPDPEFVERIAAVYRQSGYEMRPVVREVLLSRQFWSSDSYWARYSWPVEYVVRALKEVGWTGFSVDLALAPLANMGQVLFEPPDVAGWDAGRTWFSTGAMLARMNFASTITANQKYNLVGTARAAGVARSSDGLLSFFLDRVTPAPLEADVVSELRGYLGATGPWTGTDAQLQAKSAGLVHLIVGSPEYQFV